MKYYVIHGDIPSKKNSKQIFINRRTGQRFITASKAYKAWHKQASLELVRQPGGSIEVVKKIALLLYPSTKRKSDLSNKAESIMDLLVDCGIIEDDNWFVVGHLILQFGGVDKKNPRCEIFIES